ncbi:MAG: iron ABC transporter permease [Candidatus Omnitrophica bacterium]|nr:iron ABC transporter permease [Candidatus Omnitrophota bacterium]
MQTFLQSFLKEGGFSLAQYSHFFSLRSDADFQDLLETWSWWEGSRVLSPGLQAMYGSLLVSILSVLLAGMLGIPIAFFFERNEFPSRSLFAALMLLPLTLPPVVGVVSFDLLFSESGMIPRGIAAILGLDSPPFSFTGRGGIVAVHGYAFFPFFFLMISNAIRDTDSSLVEASRGMGNGAWKTFWKVEIPMLVPALFGAAVMVFMLSMASFSAPVLFDVDGMYLSTHIYNLKSQNLMTEAYTATAIFAAASLSLLVILRYLRGATKYQPVGKGVPRRRYQVQTPWGRSAASILGTLILFLVLLPHLSILLWSFTRDGSWTYQILPPEYTVENYVRLLGQGAAGATVLQPVKNSLWMASFATALNLIVGIGAAYVIKARGTVGRGFTDFMVMFAWALPGTVIAINLLVAFNQPSWLALGMSLSGSVFLLPIAYFVRNIPLVVRPLVAAWERTGEEVEEAARSLGSGRLRMLRTVSLPMIFPSLVAGGLLAFVTALGEFVSSAVLYTPENKPISMAIFSEFHAGSYGLCSAYGVLLILLIATVMFLGRKSLQGPGL